jgi:hypothetical protein
MPLFLDVHPLDDLVTRKDVAHAHPPTSRQTCTAKRTVWSPKRSTKSRKRALT